MCQTRDLAAEFGELNGEGVTADRLYSRAKSKIITDAYTGEMLKYPSMIYRGLQTTRNCNQCLVYRKRPESLLVDPTEYRPAENVYVGRFCKKRWCTTCNRVREAQTLKKFQPLYETWNDKCLVTLSRPNIEEERLPNELFNLYERFADILNMIRQRKYKNLGEGGGLDGVRKLEVTYNPERNDYHPHFHMIVKNSLQAEFIMCEWLKRNPDANQKAQDVRKCDAKGAKELHKYFSRIVEKSTKNHEPTIYPYNLIKIFEAVSQPNPRRIMQPFGEALGIKVEDFKDPKPLPSAEFGSFYWKGETWIGRLEIPNGRSYWDEGTWIDESVSKPFSLTNPVKYDLPAIIHNQDKLPMFVKAEEIYTPGPCPF